jgi:hypothetical protein
MKIDIQDLANNQFPTAMLAVTLVESGGFDHTAIGPALEKSEWQIAPCTGVYLGVVSIKQGGSCRNPKDIVQDNRLNSKMATQAFVSYMKSFFSRWQYKNPKTGETMQNAPMAFASYNGGPKNSEDASDIVEARLKASKDGRVYSLGRLNDAQLKLLGSDFFMLAQNRSLPGGAIIYTYKVLAGFQVILDLKAHGFNDINPIAGN